MKNINRLMLLIVTSSLLVACGGSTTSSESSSDSSISPSSSEESSSEVISSSEESSSEAASSSEEVSSSEEASSESSSEEPGTYRVSYELTPSIRKASSTKTDKYHMEFTLKESMFNHSATEFDNDIMMLAYGGSLMHGDEFFPGLAFDNIDDHFVTEHTVDSISYALGHHKIDSGDLVALTIGGFEYGLEWVNNCDIGLSGNHHGFELRANEIYAELKTYLASYQNPKLLITGYSRAGAISEFVAHFIMSREEINISQDDLFVYTFEAPKGLDKENKVEYDNVFNIMNSNDFITYLYPEEQYGFARYGKDVDIYDEDYNELILALDEDIVTYDFTPDTASEPKYTTPKEFNDYVMATLAEARPDYLDEDEPIIYIPTREDFVNKAEKAVERIFDIMFSLPEEEITKLVEDAKEKATDIMFLINVISVEGEIYNYISPFLDEGGYQYDATELQEECETLRQIVYGKLAFVSQVFLNEEFKANIMRAANMHYPESTYVLLQKFVEEK